MTTAPSPGIERAPDSWSDAPVGNTVALAVLAVTAVYFLLVPQVALLVAALVVGIVAVITLPVAAVAGLTLPLLYLYERRGRGEDALDDRYAA